jgi:hypothetical protein
MGTIVIAEQHDYGITHNPAQCRQHDVRRLCLAQHVRRFFCSILDISSRDRMGACDTRTKPRQDREFDYPDDFISHFAGITQFQNEARLQTSSNFAAKKINWHECGAHD